MTHKRKKTLTASDSVSGGGPGGGGLSLMKKNGGLSARPCVGWGLPTGFGEDFISDA